MKTIVHERYGSEDVRAPREYLARVTGFLYLIVAVLGMFAPVALQTLVAPGDAATTAANILA